MSKPIRMFKLVTGELVLGKYDEAADVLEDVAILQVLRAQQGIQIAMLPYGYPFEQKFEGKIAGRNFLYAYSRLPDEMDTKYLEACSKLTIVKGNGLIFNPSGSDRKIVS